LTVAARLARFVVERLWDDLSEQAREELKIRVLDALGCALAATKAPPVLQLECLRAGFWGTRDTWGRMLTYGANER
jgi:2-methylcitrate dehydratase